MSEISVKPRSYKKLTLFFIIVVVAIISLIAMAVGFNWFGIAPSDGSGGWGCIINSFIAIFSI